MGYHNWLCADFWTPCCTQFHAPRYGAWGYRGANFSCNRLCGDDDGVAPHLGEHFIGHNAGYGIIFAFVLFAICGVLLTIFAIFEKAPREAYLKTIIPKEDKGWTAEDALKSGL